MFKIGYKPKKHYDRAGVVKIVYILDAFPVLSETFIVREILELKRNGHDIIIFSLLNTTGRLSGSIIHSDSEELKKDVYYFDELRKKVSKPQMAAYHLLYFLRSPFNYLKTLFFSSVHYDQAFRFFLRSAVYIKKLKQYKAEHIHAHFALKSCKLAMLISMITGIPYSFTIHAHDIFIPEKAELMTDKFNRSKFVASISRFNRDYVLKQYPLILPDKIKIVHCGIDVDKITPPDHKVNNKKFKMLSVGRLDGQKGFNHLIQACNILKNEMNIDFQCIIIGEGEDRLQLEEAVATYRLAGVVCLKGALEQKEVMEFLQTADVFVLPCVVKENGAMDGIPVALMEAMAMEIPVISSRLSGIPELIEKGGGLLVESGDAKGLAVAINKFFSLSREQRIAIGKKGRAVIRGDFNLTQEVHKLESLFKK